MIFRRPQLVGRLGVASSTQNVCVGSDVKPGGHGVHWELAGVEMNPSGQGVHDGLPGNAA